MIYVSDTYRPFPAVRHVGVGISFGVFDLTAKPNATWSSSEDGAIGEMWYTLNDKRAVSGKYATLEPGLWRLDGSYQLLPDDLVGYETGWWSSSVSGEDGVFADAPWVQYDFSVPVSTIGWDLFYDGKAKQFPARTLVTVYNADGSARESREFSASSSTQFLDWPVEEYYGVRFTFLQTSEPRRRVRFLEIVFGHSEAFDGNTIERCTMRYSLDPIAETFPSAELEFTFDNSDKKYNLLSPDGLYQYLQEGQHLDTSISIDGESVSMGSFYFSAAAVSGNVILPTVRGNDIVFALDTDTFRGGDGTEMTLSDAVALVLAGSELRVMYGDGVADRPVVMALRECSKREALRLLAQAAMCSVWCDRRGNIRMESIAITDPTQELTSHELYDYSGVSIAEPVDMAEVVVSGADGDVIYTAGSGRNVKTISNPCVAPSAGADVAAWVLAWANRRKIYKAKNRCDPAVELGDTNRIADIYGNKGLAVVTSLEVEYTGGLSAVTGGVGE